MLPEGTRRGVWACLQLNSECNETTLERNVTRIHKRTAAILDIVSKWIHLFKSGEFGEFGQV